MDNSLACTVFLESIDASEYSKTAAKYFELLDSQIEKIEENVIQVITDNHSSYILVVMLFMIFTITVLHFFLKLDNTCISLYRSNVYGEEDACIRRHV